MNNEDIPEQSAKMEEGTMVASTGVPTGSATNSITASTATDKRLSTVSKMYDTSGTGELDEVQLAMRDMDQTGRGHLTNDKVYGLMQEQLKMQRSMFQMKKVIIGLLAFVVILALSNLGTSFASAILAKDATTNESNELVSKATGEVLSTGKSVVEFQTTVTEDAETGTRKLCQNVNTLGGGPPEIWCSAYSSDFTTMLEADAKAMLKACRGNKIIKMVHTFGEGDKAETHDRTVCDPDWGCTKVIRGPKNSPTEGDLCIGNSGLEMLYVRPQGDGMYSISPNEQLVAATDTLTANVDELCNVDGDCDTGLNCELNVLAWSAFPRTDCTATTDCANLGSTYSCYDGTCSECGLSDASTCGSDSSKPICTTFDGATEMPACGCDSDSDCTGTDETCGSASCEETSHKFCSADHDLDRLCTSSCKKPRLDMVCTVEVGGDPSTVCEGRLFCQLPGETCTDNVQQTGVCKDPDQWNLTCPDSPNGSCVEGCDGVIYNHQDCAQANSISVRYERVCPRVATLGGCGGAACGDTQFCLESASDDGTCGNGSNGACTDKPEICFEIYEPVCGCDGIWYDNECKAHRAGVNAGLDGLCQK